MRRILIAVSNPSALMEFIHEISSQVDMSKIDVFYVDDGINQDILGSVKKVLSGNNISKAFIYKRTTGLYSFIRNAIVINMAMRGQKYSVLLGSGFYYEESFLIAALSRTSDFYGVVSTFPPSVVPEGKKRRVINKITWLLSNVVKVDKVEILKYWKALKSKFFRTIIRILPESVAVTPDDTALRCSYLNNNFIKAHISPDPYWVEVLKEYYTNDKFITYQFGFDTNIEQVAYDNILLLGPTTEASIVCSIEILARIKEINNINDIYILSHPRFRDLSLKLKARFDAEYNDFSVTIISGSLDISSKIPQLSIGIVIGYYSSIFIRIMSMSPEVMLIVPEKLNCLAFEFDHDIRDFLGFRNGFNRQIATITSDGNLVCFLPDSLNKSDDKIFSNDTPSLTMVIDKLMTNGYL